MQLLLSFIEIHRNELSEKGNDDARNGSPRRTDLPKGDKELVVNYCDGYEDGKFED